MAFVFEIGQGKKVFLEQRADQILARQINGDVIGRCVILAGHVRGGLSGVLFENVLYFSYLNDQGQLILRSIYDAVIYCQVGVGISKMSEAYETQLLVIRNKLAMLYTEKQKQGAQDTYALNLLFPFERSWDRTLVDGLCSYPKVAFLQMDEKLFLGIADAQGMKLIGYDENLQGTEWVGAEALQDVEQRMREQNRQEQLQLEASMEQLQRQKEDLETKLESAKQQYTELMDVATQYRDEAIKWRSKFL